MNTQNLDSEGANKRPVNLDYFDGSNKEKANYAYISASGMIVDRPGQPARPNSQGDYFNGGIIMPKEVDLEIGSKYYRFGSDGSDPSKIAGGEWWVDKASLRNIYQRFIATGGNDRLPVFENSGPEAATFREWLAVTFSMNRFQRIIVAELKNPTKAYQGPSRLAEGTHEYDNRRFGYAPHLAKLFGIRQTFIPRLWEYREKAFKEFECYEFHQLPLVVKGDIR